MLRFRGALKIATTDNPIHTSFIKQQQLQLSSRVSRSSSSRPNYYDHYSRRRNLSLASEFNVPRKKSRLQPNEEITAEFITVVDESGKLSGPHRTEEILDNFDLDTKSLVIVQEGNPEDGRPPLCKIIDKSILRQKSTFSTKIKNKTKKKSVTTKEIEISWAVDNHDLNTKLRRLREFIEKGYKIDLLIKVKRRGRSVSNDEAEQLTKKILDTVEEAGGRQINPPDGKLLSTMQMSFIQKKPT